MVLRGAVGRKQKQFFIPEGFVHGFLGLSDTAEFCYKCADFYHPGDEGGLAWNNPTIGIQWSDVKCEYRDSASADGYTLSDGTKLNISSKDQMWGIIDLKAFGAKANVRLDITSDYRGSASRCRGGYVRGLY